MATNGEVQKEFQAHAATYEGFLTLFKVGTAASLFVAAIVVLLIAN